MRKQFAKLHIRGASSFASKCMMFLQLIMSLENFNFMFFLAKSLLLTLFCTGFSSYVETPTFFSVLRSLLLLPLLQWHVPMLLLTSSLVSTSASSLSPLLPSSLTVFAISDLLRLTPLSCSRYDHFDVDILALIFAFPRSSAFVSASSPTPNFTIVRIIPLFLSISFVCLGHGSLFS